MQSERIHFEDSPQQAVSFDISEVYRLSSYDYYLPKGLIAQYPPEQRDKARLFIIDHKGKIDHRIFLEIEEYLIQGDLLVLNDTRVIPAKLIGIKDDTGGKVEILLLKEIGEREWEALIDKKVRTNQILSLCDGRLKARVISDRGKKVIQFIGEGIKERIKEIGLPPLPPYIKRKTYNGFDRDRYQTVYAEKDGSVAAPTAGFHFTSKLLKRLKEKGIEIAKVTLHIGVGTFMPVSVNDIRDHEMEPEFYQIPKETADAINKAKKEGRRVIAVGTTAVRALEASAEGNGKISQSSGYTNLFIYPGFRFKVIDGLITNFHLPRSTLLMLVSAFAGHERIMDAYNKAIKKGYRFYSYGDAMFILIS